MQFTLNSLSSYKMALKAGVNILQRRGKVIETIAA